MSEFNKKGDSKFPIYIAGDPIPFNRRICNVIICKKCGEEFLLGATKSDGTRLDKGHYITIRQEPTLIAKGNINE